MINDWLYHPTMATQRPQGIEYLQEWLRKIYLHLMFPKIVLVTGAPRSGTTFISDWITESPQAYCAHEILTEIENKTDTEIFQFLLKCAVTGDDRLSKVHENDAMKWNKVPGKINLRLLGFKQPFAWFEGLDRLPYAVRRFPEKYNSLYLVTIRHPYDVVASGKHRALHTKNWPNYTVKQHCLLWREATKLYHHYQAKRFKVMYIKWERLILQFNTIKQELETFLQLDLPVFYGYEQTQEYFETLRGQVSLQAGVVLGKKRELLTNEDRLTIQEMTADFCEEFDYRF
ncbi:MAG: sulfotransferase [Acidobacteriota bacterium]